MELKSGYYWARVDKFDWQIGYYNKPQDMWGFIFTAQEFRSSELAEIDETMIIRVYEVEEKPKPPACEYKFRAECDDDFKMLRSAIPECDFLIEHLGKMGDIEVQISFEKYSLEELRNAMRTVSDGYVMLQTVMPVAEYTGVRNLKIQ